MKMVRIVPSSKASKAVKDGGEKVVPYITGLQNVANSKGEYEMRPLRSEKAPSNGLNLDDMDRQEILLMAASLGMKTEKQMKLPEIKAFITDRLGKIEIIDETDAD